MQNVFMGEERLLSVEEVAAKVQMHKVFVYGEVKRGRLPAIQMGRYIRIRPGDVERWINGKEKTAA